MGFLEFYPQTCVIKRTTGETDDLGNEIFISVFEGNCGLQRGGGGNTFLQGGRYLDAPLIIIEPSDIVFAINDEVIVTDENGRRMRFTIEQYEPVKDDDLSGTTIWLKTGDTL